MDTERSVAPAALLTALAAACLAVREASPDTDTIAGVVPSFVASPASTQEASALLRIAAAHGLTVVPRGAGTGLGWGMPPASADLVVDMCQMDQVIEHAAGPKLRRELLHSIAQFRIYWLLLGISLECARDRADRSEVAGEVGVAAAPSKDCNQVVLFKGQRAAHQGTDHGLGMPSPSPDGSPPRKMMSIDSLHIRGGPCTDFVGLVVPVTHLGNRGEHVAPGLFGLGIEKSLAARKGLEVHVLVILVLVERSDGLFDPLGNGSMFERQWIVRSKHEWFEFR